MSVNDKQIKEYKQKIESRRKSLGPQPKTSYITHQILELPRSTMKLNLNLCNTLEACVKIARDLLWLQNAHDDANKELGVNVPLIISGYTAEEWIADLKTRCDSIKWKEGKKELDNMDVRLSELLSAEAKTAEAIADIANTLGI